MTESKSNAIIVQSFLDLQKLVDTLDRKVVDLAKIARSLVHFMGDDVSQAQVLAAIKTIVDL